MRGKSKKIPQRKIYLRKKRLFRMSGKTSFSFVGFVFFILAFSLVLGIGPTKFSLFRMNEILRNSGDPVPQPSQTTENLQLKTFEIVSPTPQPVVNANRQLRGFNTGVGFTGQCSPANINSLLVIDQSSTMTGSPSAAAKTAAKTLVDIILQNPNNKIGLITIDSYAHTIVDATNDATLLKSVIDLLQVTSQPTRIGTCVSCGVIQANALLERSTRVGSLPVVILLTTGKTTYIDGYFVNPSQAIQAAKGEVVRGFTEADIAYYTVRFGTERTFETFLKGIALSTGGTYLFEPTIEQLNQTFNPLGRVCP